MRRIRHIHFVGIGGVGMSGIAEVLLNEGYKISGTDLCESANTQRLDKLGAQIHIGHKAEHLEGSDVVVFSTSIDEANPEIKQARNRRIPVVSRAAMLAELMRFRYGIAVAGTHGKTTTTSLTTSVLAAAGFDPTFVIGGRLNSAGSNAKLGKSRYLVAEADESDASFLQLKPMMSIITNIDADHMETYEGDFSCLEDTFLQFIGHLPFYGLAIVCIDDNNLSQLLPKLSRPFLTYGFDLNADIRAYDYEQRGLNSYFKVKRRDATDLEISLALPGRHNVCNALAAIACATELGVDDEAIINALEKFAGIGRRFQVLGELRLAKGSALLIDDYGHHPNEIRATLDAARQVWPNKRVVLVFQPHRYSRTQALFEDFCEVLSDVDRLLLLDVYSAGEAVIATADSRSLCRNIRQRGQVEPIFVSDETQLAQTLAPLLEADDVVLMQGAGSVSKIAHNLLNDWSRS